MRALHVALAAAWVVVVAAIVYYTGAVRLPTAIVGDAGATARRRAAAAAASGCALPDGRLKPAPLAMAESHCRDDQDQYFNNAKSNFWGGPGYDNIMQALFSRAGNAAFFGGVDGGRAITIVHVGSHLGGMFDRYRDLRRGPRLDDRLVMVEPNPLNYERVKRRCRMDPRLVIRQAALSNEDGRQWFQFSGVPNALGNGGKLVDGEPANASAVSEEGYVTDVLTLDTLLAPYPHVDVIWMDPEGWEPRIFMGGPATLARARFIVFGCSAPKWAAQGRVTTNKRTFKLLESAGFTVLLLGKERHLLANENVGPDRVFDRLTAWGFCAAVRTAPPMAGVNLRALSYLIAGVPADTPLRGPNATACLRYVAGTAHAACMAAKAAAGGGEGGDGAVQLLPPDEVPAAAGGAEEDAAAPALRG